MFNLCIGIAVHPRCLSRSLQFACFMFWCLRWGFGNVPHSLIILNEKQLWLRATRTVCLLPGACDSTGMWMPYPAVGDAMMIKRPICKTKINEFSFPAFQIMTRTQELISWGLYDIRQFLFHLRSLHDGLGTSGNNLCGSKQSTCLWCRHSPNPQWDSSFDFKAMICFAALMS